MAEVKVQATLSLRNGCLHVEFPLIDGYTLTLGARPTYSATELLERSYPELQPRPCPTCGHLEE